MLKLNVHFSQNNGQVLIGFVCPSCKSRNNSNITCCNLCYKRLPNVKLLQKSLLERLRWHTLPEDELTNKLVTGDMTDIKPAGIVRSYGHSPDILDHWTNEHLRKSME